MALGQTVPWAMREMITARLGDARLGVRLAKILAGLITYPNGSLPETFKDWGSLKATYRFFSNRRVQARAILEAHHDATAGRSLVLVAQDTSFFNFTTHPHTAGLGPIGAHDQKQRGFALHSAMAIDPENGEPLGLLGAILWSRPLPQPKAETKGPSVPGKKGPAKGEKKGPSAPEKESRRWIKMLERVAQQVPAGTEMVAVSDRESDTIEYLHAAVTGGHKVLVRATHNRKLTGGEEQRLWQAVEATDVLGAITVTVPRADNRPQRQASLSLQVAAVSLAPPSDKRTLGPIRVTAILVREVNCPAGQEPVHWLLLTNLTVTTREDAARVLRWYTYRWRIERYHFVLKSGCHVEELQLADAARIQRALAVFSIVAWRLLALTYAAREHPDEPCTRFLTADEWQALACFVSKKPDSPTSPPDLHTAVRWVAQLGGFLGRKRDGEPGVKVIWRGLRRLPDITAMWRIMRRRD